MDKTTSTTEESIYASLPGRLAEILEQHQAGHAVSKELHAQALQLLAEVAKLVEEHTSQKQTLQTLLPESFQLLEFQTKVERQVMPYLGEPPAEYRGAPNELQLQSRQAIALALDKMRRRHDRMQEALKPLAAFSVPEDYILDYFTDPDFSYQDEAETSDYFVQRQSIRRAREALGTYPVPEGYPFKEND